MIQEFNAVGAEISDIFPNCDIIGNHDKVTELGGFDIYLRGVGPSEQKDEQGRYYIFRKSEKKRYPLPHEITDTLIILSFLYGGSNELAKAQ